jgi:hypothetical protein
MNGSHSALVKECLKLLDREGDDRSIQTLTGLKPEVLSTLKDRLEQLRLYWATKAAGEPPPPSPFLAAEQCQLTEEVAVALVMLRIGHIRRRYLRIVVAAGLSHLARR